MVEDLDFDLTQFQLPQDIEGTAYVSIPLFEQTQSGSNAIYVIAKLRKWDASTSTETPIAQAQTETLTGNAAAKKLLIPITVPLTHFKQGETLRLTIELWQVGESPGNPNKYGIGHDPAGRTTTKFPGTGDFKVTTLLEIHIPFRLKI